MNNDLRIKELCAVKGISLAELSRRSGVSQPSISNILNSKISPNLESLQKMAAALGVEMWELFAAPAKRNGSDFCAMVKSNGSMFHASNLADLKKIVAMLESLENQ